MREGGCDQIIWPCPCPRYGHDGGSESGGGGEVVLAELGVAYGGEGTGLALLELTGEGVGGAAADDGCHFVWNLAHKNNTTMTMNSY